VVSAGSIRETSPRGGASSSRPAYVPHAASAIATASIVVFDMDLSSSRRSDGPGHQGGGLQCW
jgi:hypothetical protein